jgi:hypothetical protein
MNADPAASATTPIIQGLGTPPEARTELSFGSRNANTVKRTQTSAMLTN